MPHALATPDSYLTDFRTFETNLPDEGPDWIREVRQQALARFRELGFPTARRGNEKWKYTNVRPIADATFSYPFDAGAEVSLADIRSVAPWDDGWATAVFVNGRYSPALSTIVALDGVRVTNLEEAVRADGDVIERHLARHATYEDDGFTALNTAFLRDGAFVHVPEGESLQSPLHLIFVTAEGAEPGVSYPRTLIVAGARSELTVIESYVSLSSSRYLTDAVTEIVVGDGAQVDHYKLLLESEGAFHVATSRVYQGEDSVFSSTLYARGAAIARNDIQVLLDAPGSSCTLNGLYLTSGSQHIDNYINIEHAKPHGTSRLFYKGILDGESKAVFGGTVLVQPGADKTDAHQEDKNLLLSEKAEVASKPSLEIYADDVKCGHGATAGTIAEDAIFYMRSRGLDLETATAFLIEGFASGILDKVRVQPLRAFLEKLTTKALRGSRFGQAS
ncbi:MAG: Fe-S cluster assembly protein SufD [Chloroflexi bacterium]|nr:Fe-S cluster assembly protein SufD [Chloroflexota bacterium]